MAPCTMRNNDHRRLLIPHQYLRAMAKIAFHYVLKMDRHVTGQEPGFERIKEYIRHGTGDAKGIASPDGRPFVLDEPLRISGSGGLLRGVHHFLFAETDRDGTITVRMQLFNGAMYSGPRVVVRLGEDPFIRSTRYGHALRLYDEPVGRIDGELMELRIAKAHGHWGVVKPAWARIP